MSVNVTPIDKARRAKASLQMQALLMAQLNEEKAAMCTEQQAGIREFLLMNAKLLHEVAKR